MTRELGRHVEARRRDHFAGDVAARDVRQRNRDPWQASPLPEVEMIQRARADADQRLAGRRHRIRRSPRSAEPQGRRADGSGRRSSVIERMAIWDRLMSDRMIDWVIVGRLPGTDRMSQAKSLNHPIQRSPNHQITKSPDRQNASGGKTTGSPRPRRPSACPIASRSPTISVVRRSGSRCCVMTRDTSSPVTLSTRGTNCAK